MKKVLVVFGTRPEAIKMAPLVLALKSSKKINTVVCVTAQHREMLDQVLEIFDISPEYDLDIMKPGQNLFDVTSNILLKIRDVLLDAKPDVVLVHGDTTTSFVVALASFYEKIAVGHVEAGLRTHDRYAPFPEEINRSLTGRIASHHFAPTKGAANNLLSEGIDEKSIFVTGNTVIDALIEVVSRIDKDQDLARKIRQNLSIEGYVPDKKRFLLVTGHRRENFGEGFENICMALREFAINNPDVDIVYPVHLNPNVAGPVRRTLGDVDNIYLLKPLDYLSFVHLLGQCYVVLTDSGGIQEEAPSLGKPVLVMRDVTERPEAVDAGVVKLVGTDKDVIIDSLQRLFRNEQEYASMSKALNPYGDGNACRRIVDVFLSLQ